MQMTFRNNMAMAFLTLICHVSFAWESELAAYPPAPIGALPKSVTLENLDVDIEGDLITISYRLRNTSDAIWKAPYSIYMPIFSWEGVGAEYADRNIPEFKVLVNSSATKVDRKNYAFLHGKNITAKLVNAKVNPELVASWGRDFKNSSDIKINIGLNALVMEGVFEDVSDVLIPKWQLLTTIAWDVRIQKNSTSILTLQYRARPEFAPTRTDDKRLLSDLLKHCGTPNDAAKIRAQSEYALVKKYIVPVQFAQNLSPRIRVNFSPTANSSNAIAYMCGDKIKNDVNGTPALKTELLNFDEGSISVLLVSPQ